MSHALLLSAAEGSVSKWTNWFSALHYDLYYPTLYWIKCVNKGLM